MQIGEQQRYEIIDRMTHEGDPDLMIGPLSDVPSSVPASWAEALRASDPSTAVARIWAPLADRLPRVYRALQERLLGVGLLRTDEVPLGLIYFFGDGDDLFGYRGRLPMREYEIGMSRLPTEFLEFYRVHDGWVLDYDEDEGPLPSGQWTTPDQLQSDVRWKPPPGVHSFSDTTVVFRSGKDLAFAFECSSQPPMPILFEPPAITQSLLDMWVAIDDHVSRFLLSFDRVRSSGPRSELARNYDAQLKRVSARAAAAPNLVGAAGYRQWFRLLLERASLEGSTPNEFHREALQQGGIAVERSTYVDAEELLVLFGLAHALGEIGTAHFLASVPQTLWMTGSREAIQLIALFDLFHGQTESASLYIEQAVGQIPDDQPNVSNADAISLLLTALVERNRFNFERYRAQILREDDPESGRDGINLSWLVRIAAFDAVARQIGLVD